MLAHVRGCGDDDRAVTAKAKAAVFMDRSRHRSATPRPVGPAHPAAAVGRPPPAESSTWRWPEARRPGKRRRQKRPPRMMPTLRSATAAGSGD